MNAASVAEALGGGKPEGKNHITTCPLCEGRLSLSDGSNGRLLVTCWGGCSGMKIFAELKRSGVLDGKPLPPRSEEEIKQHNELEEKRRKKNIVDAQYIWNEAIDIYGTTADTYLRSRGIDASSPYIGEQAAKVLRFHSRLKHSENQYRPGLVAKIEHVHEGFLGIHQTFLAMDGSGKAALEPARKFKGAVLGGAVRLGTPQHNTWLVIGEGIETTMSVMQSTELPGWAALSANGIRSLVLPPEAFKIIICADNDKNGVGQKAAHDAAQRMAHEGRRVRIALPPLGYDFNDVLMGKDAS